MLVHIGVLAEENHLHFAATAGKGGPLGELVQWCDLIMSLYVLGHEVQVTVDHQEFTRYHFYCCIITVNITVLYYYCGVIY